MFWIKRRAPAEPTAEVSIHIVWSVMSAGISRQQMVTVCLLNFCTHRHMHTYTHTSTINVHLTEIENKFMPLPFLHQQVLYTTHLHKHTHTHTSPTDKTLPVSTMTSVLFPADESGTADDRLIERSSSLPHPSFLPVYHFLAVQSICCKERENNLGQPWPSSHPEAF